MKTITYTGMADRKEFSAKDFERHGIEDQNKVAFTPEEPTQEVSDAAWAFLSGAVSGESGHFKLEEAEDSPSDDDSQGEVDAGADAGSSDDENDAAAGESLPEGTDVSDATEATTETVTRPRAKVKPRT